MSEINVNVHEYSYKVHVIIVIFSRNLNFLNRFSKNNRISHFMKILPVGVEVFHEDGQI